jgi:DNA-directed RNA polymerase specialized sigma24 family protein
MAESAEQMVLAKLYHLVRIMAVSVTNGLKQRDQIALLNRAGFAPKEIAELLGTTSNTVSVELSGLRKAATKRKGKRNRSETG